MTETPNIQSQQLKCLHEKENKNVEIMKKIMSEKKNRTVISHEPKLENSQSKNWKK